MRRILKKQTKKAPNLQRVSPDFYFFETIEKDNYGFYYRFTTQQKAQLNI